MQKLWKDLKRFKDRYRKFILMATDVVIVSLCYLLTWAMLMGRISLTKFLPTMLLSWGVFVVVFFVVFLLFGMYESLWRYAEAYEFFKCSMATLVTATCFVLITQTVLRPPMIWESVPLAVNFLSAMLAGMATLYLRMMYRAYRNTSLGRRVGSGTKKVLLVGAGQTGNAVLQDLQRAKESKYEVVCVVDDDPNKIGRTIQRVKVMGSIRDIPRLVDNYGIDVIILAIPAATNAQKKRIMNLCARTKCQLKKVPDLYAFVTDTTAIASQIHDVSVEDLLGREVIDIREGAAYLTGKKVLITGGGGSIGSELCRQIALQNPKSLIIIDIYENNAYEIQQELIRQYGSKLDLHVEIASVRDTHKMELIFEKYSPDIVYHAAAHKHVPLMETAPEEAVKNNIFGTWNIARCADKFKVKRFVMISTDKAVNPTNVMGATKRVCEMIIQSMDQISKTEFVAVRFGNVLGSNGSVIPLFKEQIAAGGPVTVTHPDIIRYFMTIPEAVSLVLKAGEMARGGEIFVLNMGEPVKILSLAENLIRLSGYEPYKDIEIVFSGLRPGEKLYEELLMGEEGLRKTNNEKIFIGEPIDVNPAYLFDYLTKLKPIAYGNQTQTVVAKLHELVPTFVTPEAKNGEVELVLKNRK
ncbi:FlaA1/EpsC-like NDP-sugar epimerase [Hydrogenoanaerobacterium saccharovorans]|uniref:NDP-sugar epimerase, includes UDP-GlcNAc-inverting 4,6-dehydratase FlaA1 and capsular polysaccharide biosynthesis protein EpsC n=1 Tax=Hydrogenoanaerobacterium saccharovorans TaxID=474960 RepID=A0A1H8E2A9_9FIRM|nr:nucleoside-diphosphate sugar epimerase/dehydratase [Hydrogenoanaerobacterium saccharovorans]RPF42083.1 FlaA1/EpsC-like NDP-sugar epimerase [Hydrogenoanaerobacterium saccharovorans]SEN13244.1 NDP-sugar epimerase, includes UDP-GlcNAc-inverting 4,6-dehydratase FlaA1 and capsular polysaccharide biosynthesis protein EpsC [Hydrogenoanaerobacterium saccharovorans]